MPVLDPSDDVIYLRSCETQFTGQTLSTFLTSPLFFFSNPTNLTYFESSPVSDLRLVERGSQCSKEMERERPAESADDNIYT